MSLESELYLREIAEAWEHSQRPLRSAARRTRRERLRARESATLDE